MRRIVYRRYGDPVEVLTQTDEPSQSPGDGEALVNLTVRPVHSGDILMVTGTHDPVQRPVPPEGFTPGCEGTGTVEAVGPGVDPSLGLAPGVRVCFCAIGTWRDKIVLPVDALMLVPPDVDDDLAAQLSVNPIAALLLTREILEIADNRPGILRLSAVEKVLTERDDTRDESGIVLLSAAGSIVAKLMAAMLREKGFTPLGMVRSQAKADVLSAATGIAVVATDKPDWQDKVRTLAGGHTIFAALDSVGGEIGNAMLKLLSPGGTLVSYGALSGEPLVVQQAHLWMEGKKVRGFGMIHWTQLPYETRVADMAAATEFVLRNRHLIPLTGEFSLSEINEAVRLFTQPGRDGAVLVRS
ncbi:zinc-binding dehydrogenase family protein [Burkholderia cenocepacia]|uniref:Zinc-binding dehydrogenase family protein n=1 Tax=Burkholderia cenocepacia TaxID=95486 RepID=A0AAN0RXD5_9BURK|nr:zinc-binding dehydrogenase family protein [Burkholderia cenocepacia]